MQGTYCFSKDGEVISVSWNELKEKQEGCIQKMSAQHHGTCVSLLQSPFFPNILLSAGDWTINVWKDNLQVSKLPEVKLTPWQQPLLTSPCASSSVTVVRMSPTRPAVFFAGKSDGSVDMWDLLDKSHSPTLSQHVCAAPITSLEFMSSKKTESSGF
jgi:WD40 repeat protein